LWLTRTVSAQELAGIQVSRDVVAGRADHLDAARVGAWYGFAPMKAAENSVNVDDAQRGSGRRFCREVLHVARQHDEFDFVVSQERYCAASCTALLSLVTLSKW